MWHYRLYVVTLKATAVLRTCLIGFFLYIEKVLETEPLWSLTFDDLFLQVLRLPVHALVGLQPAPISRQPAELWRYPLQPVGQPLHPQAAHQSGAAALLQRGGDRGTSVALAWAGPFPPETLLHALLCGQFRLHATQAFHRAYWPSPLQRSSLHPTEEISPDGDHLMTKAAAFHTIIVIVIIIHANVIHSSSMIKCVHLNVTIESASGFDFLAFYSSSSLFIHLNVRSSSFCFLPVTLDDWGGLSRRMCELGQQF